MNKLVWKNIGRFALLMALQLLVLNHVYLGGYVMPMLYVLFILMLPTGMKRIPLLLIAFGTGLVMDVMCNALLTRGEPIAIDVPSIYSVTPQYFISYLMLMLAAFYLVFYTIELFGFRSFGGVILATVASTVVTTMLAVLYQYIFLKKETTV